MARITVIIACPHVVLARHVLILTRNDDSFRVPLAIKGHFIILIIASSDTAGTSAFFDQLEPAQSGANSALCMYAHMGISTQRSDGGEES